MQTWQLTYIMLMLLYEMMSDTAFKLYCAAKVLNVKYIDNSNEKGK